MIAFFIPLILIAVTLWLFMTLVTVVAAWPLVLVTVFLWWLWKPVLQNRS